MTGIAGKKNKFKIVAAVVIVLIFAAVALPFLIDADQFRPQIESRLSAELGRDVRLGKLRLSLFSGRFSVDDISIMDNPEFDESPFITASSFYMGVELKPLIFGKKVHITEISLDRPSIYLRRTPDGEWNFSDIGGGRTGEAESSMEGSAPVSDIKVGRLSITNGRIEIIEARKKPSAYEKVTLSVDNLSRAAASPFTLSAAMQDDGLLALQGTFGPLNQEDMLLTPFAAVLEITRFNPAASGFIPGDAGLSGLLDFSCDLNSDGSTAQSKGKASVSNLRLVNGGALADKPVSLDYGLRYDLKKKTGTLTDATVGFGQAAMRLYGDFDAGGDVASLEMNLGGNGISLEEFQEFLPSLGIILPKGAALKGGTLDTEITVEGPLNNLTMDGRAEITGTRLAGFDLGDKLTFVAQAAGLKSSPDTLIEKLHAAMRWTAREIAVSDIQLVVPALGELSGTGTISPKHELDFTMRATVSPGALATFTEGRSFDISFFVRGDASDPKFVPDYKDTARSLVDAVFSGESPEGDAANQGNRIIDSLKGIFGRR